MHGEDRTAPPHLFLVEADPRERHLVTILTTHLRGMASLRAHRSLEQIAEVTDRAIAILREQMERYGGEVVRAGSDGLTAVFGLRPIREPGTASPSDDQAERALRASLAVRRTVRRVSWPGPGGADTAPGLSLGLATGAIVLNRVTGSLVGTAAETAAWLAAQAEPGQILAEERAGRAARDLFDATPWSGRAVINAPDHLEIGTVREILGLRSALPEGFLGPLVGRQREMQQLGAGAAP